MPLLAPIVPTLPPEAPRTPARPEPIHLHHRMIGWDGSTWDLCDADAPVRLNSGVTGLTMPPHDRYTLEYAGIAGSRATGTRTLQRPVFWPIRIYTPQKAEWYALDAAFWRTMDPDETNVWEVTNPVTGEVRRLDVAFVDDNNHAVATDPGLFGWMFYGVNLVADRPYWYGDPISRTFTNRAGGDWLPDEDDEWVVQISPGSTLATAQVTNPGDVQAYPTWTLTGTGTSGITSAIVGLDDKVIDVPFSIPSGESLTISTDPLAQTATMDDGTSKTASITGTDGYPVFAGIPRGAEVKLALSMVGEGTVTCEFRPQYRRAFG